MSRSNLSRLAVGACLLSLIVAATPAQAIDPKLLPPDSEVVLTINLRQLLNSELAKSHEEVVRQLRTLVETHLSDAEAQRWLEKIDFDLFRDLDRITVATTGSKVPEFIMLEGRFNAEKIAATGKEAANEQPDHLKLVKIEGQPAYEIRVDGNDNPTYAGLIGKDKLILTQTKDGFADAVARVKATGTKGTSKLKKEVRDVLEAGGDKQSISLAATGPGLVKLTEGATVNNIEQLQGLLQNISAVNLSLLLTKQVNFELAINSKDKASADEMAKIIVPGLGLVKLMLKSRADKDANFVPALKIAETMRVAAKGNNVVLTGEITAEMLGKIIKNLPQK